MERMRGSSGVFGRFWATDFGSWTSTPWCRRGAVTMKMTRSTSMTSTRGVTLMSEKAFASSSSLKATCRPALGEVALGQVHELELEVAHLGARRAHLPAEVVVRDERGHRGDEAGGGVDEGFRDARRHDDDRRRALLGDLLERDHDAHDGSEEADERRGRGGGGEERHPAPETRRLDPCRALERAAGVETTRLGRGMSFLATTASATPFIGLFGTVMGIMIAFQQIAQKGSTSIVVVAPGIAEALINTAAGLVAAVPALIAYNNFGGKMRAVRAEMRDFALEFMNLAERHFT